MTVQDAPPSGLRIDDLTPTERSLLAHATTDVGRTLDMRGAGPTESRIRAAAIAWILTRQPTEQEPPPIAVRVRGVNVVGRLNLGGRRLPCPLELIDCTLDAPLVLTKTTAPNISLRGSRLRGLYGNPLQVSGTLNLGEGFHCIGPTKLFRADLGELAAERGVFENPGGFAVNADYLHVRGFATFERARLLGTLRMLGARVDGQLDCTAAQISAPAGENAVELDSATLTGGAVFSSALIHGGIWLVNTTANAEVAFERATIRNPGRYAIDASATRMGDVNLTEAVVRGEVEIVRAELDTLDCYHAGFLDPRDASLDLDSTTIAGPFHAHFSKIEGRLDLTNTSIGILRDTQRSWPPSAHLIGARYDKIEGDEDALDADKSLSKARLQWLKLHDRYHPQKYTALATAYQNVGQEALARQAAIAGEHERRMSNKKGARRGLAWTWSTLLRLLVGYGYAPTRALWWLIGLIVGGSVLTAWAHTPRLKTPPCPGSSSPYPGSWHDGPKARKMPSRAPASSTPCRSEHTLPTKYPTQRCDSSSERGRTIR